MKKAIPFLISLLAGLLLLYGLLFSALQLAINDEDWFYGEYERLRDQGALVLDMSVEDSTRALMRLIDYMEGRAEDIEIQVSIGGEAQAMYNPREAAHMVDVRALYQGFRSLRNWALLLAGGLALCLCLYKRREGFRSLCQGYLWACGLFLLLLLVAAAFVLGDFNSFWTQFHYLFFDNDLWLLNPATDNMINICPLGLFYDIVLRLGLGALLPTGLLALGAGLCVKRRKQP